MSQEGWRHIDATAFCAKVTDGTHDSPKRKEFGKPLITSKHIKGRNIDFDNAYFISEEDFRKINQRSKVDQWDVIISMIGEYCGFCYVERNPVTDYAVKNVGLFKTGNKIKADWLYYFLNSPEGKNSLASLKSGTSQPYLSLSALRSLPILIPKSEKEMENVVSILSALDEKIELNRQTNSTLEAIAQAIFKEWFVEFNFPGATGKMVESELGMIPLGWRVGNLGEIIKNYDSKRVPLSSREREKRKGIYPYYGAASILDYIDDFLFDGVYLLMGEDGTVITDDDKPVLQYVTGKFWVNNHAHVLQGNDLFSTEFIYLTLKNTNIKHIITGAVQPKINQGNMNNLSAIIPDTMSLKAFQDIIKPTFAYILGIEQQTATLEATRDVLLPKLMSGEIEV